jgi:hypothetical protein
MAMLEKPRKARSAIEPIARADYPSENEGESPESTPDTYHVSED